MKASEIIEDEAIEDYLDAIWDMSWRDRVQFAWLVVRGRK